MNVETLENDTTKEIYEIWKSRYFFWKAGFKTFYAPWVNESKLMIISYQPGGGEADFEKEGRDRFEKGDFNITQNTYVDANYVMSHKMRSFFDFDPGYSILKQSIIIPLIFFRAPSIQIWEKELPQDKRKEMEEISFSKVKEIIEVVQPEKILVVGIKTYQKLKELIGGVENEKIIHSRSNNKTKMVVTAQHKNTKIFAVIHFTGARISDTDWQIMKNLFKNWVNT